MMLRVQQVIYVERCDKMDKKNKVILVTLSPKTHRTSEENLGLGYLKSSLNESGYSVEIIDGWLCNYTLDEVFNRIIADEGNILFIGFSSYMSNTRPTIDLINKIKLHNKKLKIVCGGFGPTFYPEEYLNNGSDFIIRGEGEKTIVELANCFSNYESPDYLKNIGYKNDKGEVVINIQDCLNDNLDLIPFPSRDTIDTAIRKKSYINMVTSRGCSGNCDFCSVIAFYRLSDGRVFRSRSIKNIVDEMEQLYNSGVRHIKIVDDSFVDGFRDENWCKEFADEIENRKLSFKLRGQIRADKITENILINLKRAGFFSFACGIENGSQTALTRMNKKASLQENVKALNLLKKYGYIVQMGYILFDDMTTYDELMDNYVFLRNNSFTVTKGIFSEMYSTKGTKYNNKLQDQNKIEIGNFESPNGRYYNEDVLVTKIYNALKAWHKSHSYIYDMTIDPIISPKVVDDISLYQFYQNAIKLKDMDLDIFKDILFDFKNNNIEDVKMYINEKIRNTSNFYSDINNNVRRLYKRNNLKYNADINPFI